MQAVQSSEPVATHNSRPVADTSTARNPIAACLERSGFRGSPHATPCLTYDPFSIS